MNEWHVGLASWIIQDGNYGDFFREQHVQFALEFYPLEFRPTELKVKAAKRIGGSSYQVTARVDFVANNVWVIDFGISAYQQSEPPQDINAGSWIDAVIHLGIDPFFYFEELAYIDGMPPLIHRWQIIQIQIETAPFIESIDERGTKVFVRDESKSAFRDIERTDAWNDDGGNAEYVLNCKLIDQPPTRRRQQPR